jgi:glycerol-3-phosphate dehydrogenase subunit B
VPSADVVVVGAGLAGLATAHALAGHGARVVVLAKGHASTHWVAGTLDVAAPPAAATSQAGVAQLATIPGHPYADLAPEVVPAVETFIDVAARDGLIYVGGVDSPIRPLPTGIGGVRPGAIVPEAQAAALVPWTGRESLVVCGIAGFKDLWPVAVAASLARPAVWQLGADPPSPDRAPARVVPAEADLPGVEGRRNLTALHLARAFDDRAWRDRAIDAIAKVVDAAIGAADARVALPAVLGLRDHAAVIDALRDRLGRPVMELPLVPPSIPGLRLYDAWRTALRVAGVRIQLGESVSRTVVRDGTVGLVATPAAVREFAIRTSGLVLATGGIVGGGIVGQADGRLEEVVLGLPVEAPPRDAWFSADPFDPRGHGIEAAGIRVDADLRPLGADGRPTHGNVRVVGSLLAGQRWLREHSGDGVAIASARRAAAGLAAGGFRAGPPPPATADTTSAQVRAAAPVVAGTGRQEGGRR